ncbi:hypothetical protein Tco_0604412 [Tanacetum coccineum]
MPLSFSHLIKDYDFHEKRMAKQIELNKKKGKGTGQGENRPVWNNVQSFNHQNKFVPKAVLTKTGIYPVNTARQNLSRQATTTSTARKVNTARPIVNEIRLRNNFYKSHSPIRRPFNRTTTPKANFSNQKVKIAEVKAVSVVGGMRETAVKPSAGRGKLAGYLVVQFVDEFLVRRRVVDDMMTFEVVGIAGTKIHTARHQELASPKQTASALAIPGQMATGKESSNPLMADSLPIKYSLMITLQEVFTLGDVGMDMFENLNGIDGILYKLVRIYTDITLVTPTKVSSQSDQSEDHLRVLSAAKILAEAAKQGTGVSLTQTYTRRRRNVGTGSGGVSTASRILSTAGVSTASESDNTAGGRLKTKGNKLCKNLSLQTNSRRGFKFR